MEKRVQERSIGQISHIDLTSSGIRHIGVLRESSSIAVIYSGGIEAPRLRRGERCIINDGIALYSGVAERSTGARTYLKVLERYI